MSNSLTPALSTGITLLLAAIPNKVHFDGCSEHAGVTGLMHAVQREPFVPVAAFDELGVPAVSLVMPLLTLSLPNLAAALVVLVINVIAANSLAEAAR